MANEIQTQMPVYLPKARGDEDVDGYNTSVAQNENALNQNFDILFNAYIDLLARVTKLEV